MNAEERRMLAALAERLERTQSDVVRLLVREAVHELCAKSQAGCQQAGTLGASEGHDGLEVNHGEPL
jgi:hypothetical protein